jgi:general stress protein 26
MDSTTTSAFEHLSELIHGINVAMLTTVDRTGHLHSRPMMTLRHTADNALWFFTEASSHIVDDVNGHHPVNLSYADLAQGRYISVSGRARVVNDRTKKSQLWENRLAQWLPHGCEHSSVILLRIEVHDAEVWNAGGTREVSASVEFNVNGGALHNEKITFR